MTSESEGYDLAEEEEDEEEEEEEEDMYVEENMSDSDDFEPPKIGARSGRKPVSQCSLQSISIPASHGTSAAKAQKSEGTSQASTSSAASKGKAKGLKLKKRKTQEKEEQKEDKEKVESAKKISPQGPITQPYAAPSQTPDVLSSEKANSEEKPKNKADSAKCQSGSKPEDVKVAATGENSSAAANAFKLPKLDLHSKKVFEYMKSVNRPFGNADIARKFAKDLTRSQVNRAVENLLAKNLVLTNDSQKIVWINQDVFGSIEPQRLSQLTDSINEQKQQVANLEQKVQTLKSQIQECDSTPANSQIMGEIKKIRNTVEAQRQELAEKQGKSVESSNKPIESLIDELAFYKKTWKQRKAAVEDLVLDMLEAGPKSQTKKSIFTAIGMDSDEVAGVSLKSIQVPKQR